MKSIKLILWSAILCCMAGASFAQEVPLMTGDELKSQMSMPEKPVVIDVRSEDDWTDSTEKITGAVRENPHDVKAWADRYPKDKPVVLYCA